jgi:hypothetical protein
MSKQTDPIEGYYAQQSTPTAASSVKQPDRGGVVPQPTCRELLDGLAATDVVHPERQLLAARVEAVLALHYEPHPKAGCDQCDHNWPCPTVRALNGKP